MMNKPQENRGGARKGAGRKKTGRDFQMTIKLSKDTYEILKSIRNRSAYIEELIRKNN